MNKGELCHLDGWQQLVAHWVTISLLKLLESTVCGLYCGISRYFLDSANFPKMVQVLIQAASPGLRSNTAPQKYPFVSCNFVSGPRISKPVRIFRQTSNRTRGAPKACRSWMTELKGLGSCKCLHASASAREPSGWWDGGRDRSRDGSTLEQSMDTAARNT